MRAEKRVKQSGPWEESAWGGGGGGGGGELSLQKTRLDPNTFLCLVRIKLEQMKLATISPSNIKHNHTAK